MKRRFIMLFNKLLYVLCLVSAFALVLNVPAAHSNRIVSGQACKKIGERDTYGSKLFVCIKKGKKLVWSKGETLQQVSLTLYTTGLLQGDALSYSVIATRGDTCTLDLIGLSKKLQSVSLSFQKTSQIVSSFKTRLDKISRVEVDCEFSEGAVEFVPISAILGPSSMPTPTPTRSVSPTPAPSTENLGSLPIGEKTYFGQDPTYKPRCWFAKKFTNPTGAISSAAEQIVEVISPQGTRMFNIVFDVPSLLPRTSIWVSNWSINPYGCEGGIGTVRDKDITKRVFFDNYYVRSLLTSANDRPAVLGWTTVKRSDREVYGLIVRNNSKTFDICSSNETLMSLVFFNSANELIFAVAERIRDAVPTDIQATVTSWDEIGLRVNSLPNLARIEPSLIFELCNGNRRSY